MHQANKLLECQKEFMFNSRYGFAENDNYKTLNYHCGKTNLNEQQSDVIINKIIKIIADENLTIDEADKILYATTKQIKQQIVCSDMYAGGTLPNNITLGINRYITKA